MPNSVFIILYSFLQAGLPSCINLGPPKICIIGLFDYFSSQFRSSVQPPTSPLQILKTIASSPFA